MPDLLSNLRRALEDWDVVKAEQELNKPENRFSRRYTNQKIGLLEDKQTRKQV